MIAVVSYLVTEGVLAGIIDAFFGVKLDATQRIVIVGLVTAIVKSIDRELHDSGVAEKGLTRF